MMAEYIKANCAKRLERAINFAKLMNPALESARIGRVCIQTLPPATPRHRDLLGPPRKEPSHRGTLGSPTQSEVCTVPEENEQNLPGDEALALMIAGRWGNPHVPIPHAQWKTQPLPSNGCTPCSKTKGIVGREL